MSPSSSEAEPTVRGPAAGQRVFGRYTLREILGRGGMGVVWRAHDETLSEDVALKFLPDAVRWDPAAYDDLKAETRRARQLTHPNIVRIHDFVEDAGGAAISMELVQGQTLTQLRLTKPGKIFEVADIAPWLPQLCAALDYAHTQARVVHRDLKPSNLMLTTAGVLKVADFGVARSLADSVTRVSMMSAGTMVYMSPQQAMGEEPSPADDVYALGATLYELLTGKPPFHTGDVRMQLFQRKPDGIAARRRALGLTDAGKIPPTWEKMMAACLAKDAAVRPAAASAVAAGLISEVSGRVPAPAWVVCVQRARQRLAAAPRDAVGRVRNARPLTVALLAALLVLAPLAVWLNWPLESRPPWIKFPSDETRALAAWNFDGDGRDASGRDFDGSISYAVPTTDRFGRIDRALHFNGNADLLVADAPALRWGGEQPFTAALWVRDGEGGNADGPVWSSPGDAAGSLTWNLGFSRGHPSANFDKIHDGHHGDAAEPVASMAVSFGEWHHLAVVSDGEEFVLYVDGAKAAARPLGPTRNAKAPLKAALRFGRAERMSPWAFTGDLDEARLWRRALSPKEIASLATRRAPSRFVQSRSTCLDTDNFSTVLAAEFGPEARLADWEELKRLHGDDTRAWGDGVGFKFGSAGVWLQRGGRRRFDEQRHFQMGRFDGVKPDYFLAHDELGGATFLLGSWYGNQARLLAALPAVEPRLLALAPDPADGVIRWSSSGGPAATALALSWRLTLNANAPREITLALRLRDGRELRAVCETGDSATFALALAEHTRRVTANFGECEFTLVARDGLLRFRAVNALGGNPLFSDETRIANLALVDITSLELHGGAAGGLASARLIVE